jgi:hypothetical protein
MLAKFGLLSLVLTVVVAMTPAIASGAGWSVVPSPNAQGQSGTLSGVSCGSASVWIAVGSYTTGAGAVMTLAEGWNGTSVSSCTAIGTYTNSVGDQVTLVEREGA